MAAVLLEHGPVPTPGWSGRVIFGNVPGVIIPDKLSFNKMLETQIQQISSALPRPSSGASKEPVQESVKSMSTLFDGKATESSEESLEKVNEGNSEVDESKEILPMSEVSSKAILSQLWNHWGKQKSRISSASLDPSSPLCTMRPGSKCEHYDGL